VRPFDPFHRLKSLKAVPRKILPKSQIYFPLILEQPYSAVFLLLQGLLPRKEYGVRFLFRRVKSRKSYKVWKTANGIRQVFGLFRPV